MTKPNGAFLPISLRRLTAVALLACGESKSTAGIATAPVDTSTLVGTWKGTLEGGEAANSYGRANITLVLKADSTFTSEADNPLYCALHTTTWRAAAGQFTASGRDCGGTMVAFVAPVGSLRLTGTWTASSGRAGTFTVAKQ